MQDVDKVAEKYERFNVWKHFVTVKTNFKLFSECSLCQRFCILNFDLFIVSIAVHRSRFQFVVKQICCNLAA
jgi:hypothetical protein